MSLANPMDFRQAPVIIFWFIFLRWIMTRNTTINLLPNTYGVDPDLANFVNDLIYSVFFSESNNGVLYLMPASPDTTRWLLNF